MVGRSGRLGRAFLVLLLAGLVLAPASEALSGGVGGDQSPGGPTEVAKEGCTCHNADPSNDMTLFMRGVPTVYVPGDEYTMTVQLVGGPSSTGANHAGFSLLVSDGALSSPDGETHLVADGDATRLTHTADGAHGDDRSFSITWTAPAAGAGTISFWLAGNAVDGSGAPDAADQWNRLSFALPEGAAGEDPRRRDLFAGNGEVIPPEAEHHGVDLHSLGAPLRAHWLGLLGFLSVILVVVSCGFMLRYGFSHAYVGRSNLLRLRIKHRRRGDQ